MRSETRQRNRPFWDCFDFRVPRDTTGIRTTFFSSTFLEHPRQHEQRQTTYLEMAMGLAQSGIEKWTVDTGRMTMTFYDKAGREMLAEQISSVQCFTTS